MIYKKYLLKVFIVLSVLFLLASLVCEYVPVGVVKIKGISGHRDFVVSVLAGLLGSTILSLCVTSIEIKFDKNRIMTKLLNNLYSLKGDLSSLEDDISVNAITKYKFSVELNNKILLLDCINKRCNEILEDVENTYLSHKDIPQNALKSLLHGLEEWSYNYEVRGKVAFDDIRKMETFLTEFADYLKSEDNKRVKAQLEDTIRQIENKIKG